MNTLQELNQYSTNTVLDLPDDRLAGIIVDRPLPFIPEDDTRTISSTTYVANPGLNISEIINYQTANVRYQLTIRPGSVDPLPGSTISWESLPTSVSLTTVGNVYTLSGFKSANDWEEVKNFTWNLPSDYEDYPLWFVEASIIYYDEAEDREISYDWLVYDPRFYYLAQFESNFNSTINNTRLKLYNSSSSSVFNIQAQLNYLQNASANLLVEASIIAEGNITSFASLISETFIECNAVKVTVFSSSVSSQTTALIVGDKSFSNLLTSRNYVSNNFTEIFDTNTPTFNNTSGTYTVTLTPTVGDFAETETSNMSNPWIYTGTGAELNFVLSNVKYYPPKNFSSNTSLNFKISQGSEIYVNQTVSLIGSLGSFTPLTVTRNSSSTWRPNNTWVRYGGLLDLFLVGAGGGGGSPGGGGGGGTYVLQNNISLTENTSYSVTIGSGGTKGTSWNITSSTPFDNTGGNGGNSTAFGYTASGGVGGKAIWSGSTYQDPDQNFNIVPTPGSFNFNGGNSGTPYTGGTGQQSVNAGTLAFGIGGGGGGATGNGGNAINTALPPNPPVWVPGTSGAGYVYNSVTYGRGGSSSTSVVANTGTGGWNSNGASGVAIFYIHT
jgi:hypothetical protein